MGAVDVLYCENSYYILILYLSLLDNSCIVNFKFLQYIRSLHFIVDFKHLYCKLIQLLQLWKRAGDLITLFYFYRISTSILKRLSL